MAQEKKKTRCGLRCALTLLGVCILAITIVVVLHVLYTIYKDFFLVIESVEEAIDEVEEIVIEAEEERLDQWKTIAIMYDMKDEDAVKAHIGLGMNPETNPMGMVVA